MTIEIRPCIRKGKQTVAFLVSQDENHAFVLDNYVWAVAVKAVPIEAWRKDWKTLELPKEKLDKILDGLAGYAIYAGMTPEAAQYLPHMVPMTKQAQRVALDRGYKTLERHKTQATAEEAVDKKRLAGAALTSQVKKIMAEAGEAVDEVDAAVVNPADEVGTAENATETVVPTSKVAEKRSNSSKGKKLKALAAAVTEDLNEVEAKGGNPVEALKTPRPKTTKPKSAPRPKAGFDPAKLKGPDGRYKSVSAAFKGLILEGKLSDDKIFETVQKQFGLDASKRSYVQWNRNWLKKEGIIE